MLSKSGVSYKIRNPIESVPMGPYFVMEFGAIIKILPPWPIENNAMLIR